MTVGYAAFWIYLAACSNAAGITAVVLELIARFAMRPFDTDYRLGFFLWLFGVGVLVGVGGSAVAYTLGAVAGAFGALRVSSLIVPLRVGIVVALWSSAL